MNTRYSKEEQQEWVHETNVWEDERTKEFPQTVTFSALAIVFVLTGVYILNGVADWVAGI